MQQSGSGRILEGLLFGLNGLRRTGDGRIGPSNVDNAPWPISCDVRLGVDNLNMTGQTKVAFIGIKVDSPLLVHIEHVDVNIKAYLDQVTGKPVVNEVTVVKLDGVGVQLPGLGIFSSLFGLISSAFVTAFKTSIKGFIERAVLRAANFVINRSTVRFV